MDGTVSGLPGMEYICRGNSFHEEDFFMWAECCRVVQRRAEPVVLKDIRLSEDERRLTKIGELDRVLGGGIVPGSLVLVGGDPGIGKSTLLLQVCRNLALSGNACSIYFR